MNLFYLSRCPVECAEQHVDKHVVKMIVESAQLLSTAHRVLDGEEVTRTDLLTGRKRKMWVLPKTSHEESLYRSTHAMHPTAVWVRRSVEHYTYLWDLLEALNDEYRYRYQRANDHASFRRLEWALREPPRGIRNAGFEEPPQAMPEPLRDPVSAVSGYRNFYIAEKIRFATYTGRKAPDWYRPALVEYHRESGFKFER